MAALNLGEQIDAATHKRDGTAVSLASGDLTTHGVIVGMTGSGKTGLGIVLIEEALSAGVPVIAIDPKGDLTNLLLLFPNLAPADFRPWINEGDATKAGVTPDEFAAQQAAAWRDGLASWGIGPDRLAALKDGAHYTIYTPGSTSGVPLNIVGSLKAPKAVDAETRQDEIEGFVTGLLGLVGIAADPLSSREHILLANLIDASWTQGRDLDLPTLVGQVATPPIRKLGVFELDQFFPPDDRMALAVRLNGLLASSAFAAWSDGAPLDIDTLLHAPDSKARCAVVSIAHLSDEERQFAVATLLAKLVTWMRAQSGTTDLRALVYMDEVAGYVPPSAMPPAKKPIMVLMKQARAFGVGMVLATQNPVDLDYKAISNAGTWIVGRLQTERDKSRLLDGMSAASGGVDIGALSDTIGGLAKREFVLRRAGVAAPTVMTSRWSMSYLRGPLTRDQIATLMHDAPERAPKNLPPSTTPSASSDESTVMPQVAQGVRVTWLDPAAAWAAPIGARGGTRFEAAAVARAALLYDDEKAGLREQQEWEAVVFPLTATAGGPEAINVDYDDRDLRDTAPDGATYTLPAAAVADKKFWADLQRGLTDHLFRNRTMNIMRNRELKLFSRPSESAEEFKARCEQAANDEADRAAAALKDKYSARVTKLEATIQAAHDKIELAADTVKQRRSEEVLGAAGSLLGDLLGGRKSTGSLVKTIGRAASGGASRRGRSATASDRLEAAKHAAASKEQQLADLEAELAQDLTEIHNEWMTRAANVETVPISLEKADIKVDELALCWIPVA
jgi:uncharacterized protein DUF87